jgi:hypothetical protein
LGKKEEEIPERANEKTTKIQLPIDTLHSFAMYKRWRTLDNWEGDETECKGLSDHNDTFIMTRLNGYAHLGRVRRYCHLRRIHKAKESRGSRKGAKVFKRQ